MVILGLPLTFQVFTPVSNLGPGGLLVNRDFKKKKMLNKTAEELL